MTRTSDRLHTEAAAQGWRMARIRANEGRYAVDHFACTQHTLKVVYDAEGRILEATLYDGTRRLGHTRHVGPRDTNKAQVVLGWLKSVPTAKQMGVK